MKKLVAVAVLAALGAAPLYAQDSAAAKGKGVMEVGRVTATVEAIDQKTRNVTLKTSDGEKFTVTAGDDVRNLAQVNKGDIVTVEYGQALAVKLAKTDNKTRARTVTEGVQRAEPGQKPGGV